MHRFVAVVCWLPVALVASGARGADTDVVELLKDAQVTHRHAWHQGSCDLRFEVTREGQEGVAVLSGELRWLDAWYTLKFKINDPDGVRFKERFVDSEWNMVTKGAERTISYFARGPSFMDIPNAPPNIDPIYDLTPWLTFAHCCAPSAQEDSTTWDQGIGPSPTLFRVLRNSSFAHQTLPNGDIEQTRTDPSGYKNTLLFSAMEGFAVRSTRHLTPQGRAESEIDFTYQKLANGVVAPLECRATHRLGSEPAYHARYLYTNVRLPGDVTAADFTRDAQLARINRDTIRRKPRPRPAAAPPVVTDLNLDPLIRSLRQSNAPPR